MFILSMWKQRLSRYIICSRIQMQVCLELRHVCIEILWQRDWPVFLSSSVHGTTLLPVVWPPPSHLFRLPWSLYLLTFNLLVPWPPVYLTTLQFHCHTLWLLLPLPDLEVRCCQRPGDVTPHGGSPVPSSHLSFPSIIPNKTLAFSPCLWLWFLENPG